ncbi:MAG TPA: hypothetical protein VEC06_19555 [Paucimonas sp.]|nr:hypothetical protein [Paucimonas sp.]
MKKSFVILASLCGAALAAGLGGCGGGGGVTTISIGGTITGLTASGLTLITSYSTGYSTGSTLLDVAANTTSFKFTNRLNQGASYVVGVYRQPDLMTCTVTNNGGTAGSSDVTNVQVACSPNNVLGGTVTNLRGQNLKLANGSDVVSIAPSATAGANVSFTFPARVAQQANYGVTILQQPDGQTCTVANGSGTMGTTDRNDVLVNCQ